MNRLDYRCPVCGGSNFKRWELPHPVILHWILNPGLAINEILLGQRLPKSQLICRDCDGPVLERGYVPCPSCGTMHPGRHVSGKKAFGLWRGVACPSCKEPIPCLWNVFSKMILLLTFPLWSLPYFLYYRKQPLRELYQTDDAGAPPPPKAVTKKTWVFMGVAWGGIMWLFMTAFSVLATNGDGVSGWKIGLAGLPFWIFGGLAFGFLMWFFLGRNSRQEDKGA